MKKSLYFIALVFTWVVVIFLFAFVLLLTGIIPTEYNFPYSLGVAVATPSMWLLSAGLVMLLRPSFYKLILGTPRTFSKSLPTIFIVVGAVWFAFTIGGKLLSKATTEKLRSTYENMHESNNTNFNIEEELDPEDVIENLKNQYIAFCKEINTQLPVSIDEITKLNSVLFSNWNMVFQYGVDIDVNDFTNEEISSFMTDLKASQKLQISRMFIQGKYDFSKGDFRELCRQTGLKFRFSYYDINNTMIGVNVFDYRDF